MWLSTHFLVAGLFLSSSALTPEECQPLVTPLSPTETSMMPGRWNFLVGYTDTVAIKDLLKMTTSSWMIGTSSPYSPGDFVISQMDKLNATCVKSTVNVTVSGSAASILVANISTDIQLLPSCDGCMLFNINSTARDLDRILHKLHINSNATAQEVKVHSLYLMARETTLKDLDMERFQQQASCLGFSGEPDFLYDPENGFCAEGEGMDFIF